MTGFRTVVAGGFRVELDLGPQVLRIDAPEARDWSMDDAPGSLETPLRGTLAGVKSEGPVSAAVLAHKAKIFDDGLYAAVEIAGQEGAGRMGGKAGLLRSLGRTLAGLDPAVAGEAQDLLIGAARLGNVSMDDVPSAVETGVTRAVAKVLADDLRSKPIGFYTWSPELARVFQQDRMLQGELETPTAIEVLANALHGDPAARAAYEAHLLLASRLTNPLVEPGFRRLLEARDRGSIAAPGRGLSFFPPSVAHETEIIKQLYGDLPIPDGFVLIDEMIRRIRSGALDLEPRPESGWYDYQTWALEPLVVPERMPEGERLELAGEYRELLLQLFKGLMTLTRETHIKQIELTFCGSAGGWNEVFIDISPALDAEPLPTFYLRRALGYRYVRGVLEDSFGAGELERMHRLTQAGRAEASLAEELADIESLFMGAHVVVNRQLGLAPDPASGSETARNAAADRFASWARKLERDPDLGQDVRAMVPVFYDVDRRKTKVWAFLGWSRRPIAVSFARAPDARVAGTRHPAIRWGTLSAELDYPVMAEVYVDRILDRKEFRGLCDRCGTRSEILAALGVPRDPVPAERPVVIERFKPAPGHRREDFKN